AGIRHQGMHKDAPADGTLEGGFDRAMVKPKNNELDRLFRPVYRIQERSDTRSRLNQKSHIRFFHGFVLISSSPETTLVFSLRGKNNGSLQKSFDRFLLTTSHIRTGLSAVQ